jgi:hypothetical protein
MMGDVRLWMVTLSGGPLKETVGNALVWAPTEAAARAAIRAPDGEEPFEMTTIKPYASPETEVLMIRFPAAR